MAIPYPCIDTGYIYDPIKKLDRLMSDFYEAEYSQSYLFYGSITSFPWILQTYQSDPEVVTSKIRSTLMTYLQKYFDSVEVESSVKENGTAVSYDIFLYAQVIQDGAVVNLRHILQIRDNKFDISLKVRE